MKRREHYYRVGDIIPCKNWDHMKWKMEDLMQKGIETKPTGEFNDLEIIDIERRRGKKK